LEFYNLYTFKLSNNSAKIFKFFIFNVLYNTFDKFPLNSNFFKLLNDFSTVLKTILDGVIQQRLGQRFFRHDKDALISFLSSHGKETNSIKLIIDIINASIIFLFDFHNSEEETAQLLNKNFFGISFYEKYFNFFFNNLLQFLFFYFFECCNSKGFYFEPNDIVHSFISNLEDYHKEFFSFYNSFFKDYSLVCVENFFSKANFLNFFSIYEKLVKDFYKEDINFFTNWSIFFKNYSKFLPDGENYYYLYNFFGKIFSKRKYLSDVFLSTVSERLNMISYFSKILDVLELDDESSLLFKNLVFFNYNIFEDFKINILDTIRHYKNNTVSSFFNIKFRENFFDIVYKNLFFLIFGNQKFSDDIDFNLHLNEIKRNIFFIFENSNIFSSFTFNESFVNYFKIFFSFLSYEFSSYKSEYDFMKFYTSNRETYVTILGYLLQIIFEFCFKDIVNLNEEDDKKYLISKVIFIFNAFCEYPFMMTDDENNPLIQQGREVLNTIIFILEHKELSTFLDLKALKY
jgi:hypothetical protein